MFVIFEVYIDTRDDDVWPKMAMWNVSMRYMYFLKPLDILSNNTPSSRLRQRFGSQIYKYRIVA